MALAIRRRRWRKVANLLMRCTRQGRCAADCISLLRLPKQRLSGLVSTKIALKNLEAFPLRKNIRHDGNAWGVNQKYAAGYAA